MIRVYQNNLNMEVEAVTDEFGNLLPFSVREANDARESGELTEDGALPESNEEHVELGGEA